MAILTTSGRVALAVSVFDKPIHLAWGSGDASWDAIPVPEPIDAHGLVAEVGRRKVTTVRYCTPAVDGEIVVPNGRFTESATPTNHLYFRFNFDFADAPSATIREVGVFVGSTTDPALPAGQMYFEPAQVVDAGILLVLERFPKFDRSSAVRQSFEFVVTI